jgi:hypothetical protein
MLKTYQHPWYTHLSKLESTITSESKSMLRRQAEPTGQTHTNHHHHEKQIIDGRKDAHPIQIEEDTARYGEK